MTVPAHVPDTCPATEETAMLKNLDPLLGPDLLQVLAAMGHGDDLVLVDSNFPADSVARHTVSGRLVRLDGDGVVRAAKAILSVFPLDSFVEPACWRMEVVGDPNAFPDVQQEVQELIDQAEERNFPLAPIERFAFYERAQKCYAVVATTELRPYGCFIFKKGVVF